MKTWRERIAEAEQRRVCFGLIKWAKFTNDDHAAWMNSRTCVVGEVASRYADPATLAWHSLYLQLLSDTDGSGRSLSALFANSPRRLAAILNEVEDRALQLKREAV